MNLSRTKPYWINLKSLIMKTYYPYLLFFCIFILSLTSCKKDINSSISIPGEQTKSGPIPAYDFDWETTTYMPSAPSSTYNPIPMPWNGGTTSIDPNLVSDYRKQDGWKLVWNTFSPSTILGDPNYTYFFSLYNVYRGLLRIYLWHPANANATTYVNHGLSLYGSSSSILNFCATDIVEPATNKSTFAQILKQQMTSAQGTWFVFQYEMAYDANIASTTFPGFGLSWQPQWVNLTDITLNGTQTGTIEGYIGNPNQGFNFGNVLMDGALTFLGELNYAQLLGIVDKDKGEKPYESALNKGIGGIVKGFLSGILGGSSSAQPVNLTIKTDIKLSGNLVSSGLVADKKLILPGQSNSQTADGNTPLYNSIMGVVNISNAPTIFYQEYSFDNGPFEDPWGNYYTEQCFVGTFTLDNNSFSMLWNPAIINSNPDGASIQNVQFQMVNIREAYQPFGGYGGVISLPQGSTMSFNSIAGVYDGEFSQLEHIGNFDAVSSIPNSDIPLKIYYGGDPRGLNNVVRVTFDVVPNNGGPISKIVKSFKANLVRI